MSSITLSVLIPTYKRAGLLKKCIASVVASDSKDIEIIIANNGSPDNTDEVVAGFQDPRIRYFRHPENIGAVMNVRFLVEQARGKYLFFLTDDDYLIPGGLEEVFDFIQKYEPHGFKCGLIVHQILNQASYLYSPFKQTFVAEKEDFESQASIFWNAHILTTTCIRKDKIDISLYDEHISNLYPSMMFMAMAREKLGYVHVPVGIHIWENEVFWDGGVQPTETKKLMAHRGDILLFMKSRLPKGFILACEKIINQKSLNFEPLSGFLNKKELFERKKRFKYHAFLAIYSSLVKKMFAPIDQLISRKFGWWFAGIIAKIKED